MPRAGFAELLRLAAAGGYAVPAINILNELSIRAVIKAAEELKSPLILQTSVKTVKAFGIPDFGAILTFFRNRAAIPVAVHLDHCADEEFAYACMSNGWDSIMIDASSKPLEENIAITRRVCGRARSLGLDTEGELGIIMGVEDDVASDVDVRASFEDVMRFIGETKIDAVAPAIGTAHGNYTGQPELDFSLVRLLRDAGDCPVVVHGGTGLDTETFKRLIACGCSKINISTAIKDAYTGAMKKSVEASVSDPLAMDRLAFEGIGDTARRHIEIFGSKGRA